MSRYSLDDTEKQKSKKFNKKHYEKCDSGMSVIFTETGIGLKVEVRCNKCNKIKDISNYDTW